MAKPNNTTTKARKILSVRAKAKGKPKINALVGVFQGKHKGKTTAKASKPTNAQLALWLHEGVGQGDEVAIEPRPFLKEPLNGKRPEVKAILEKGAKAINLGMPLQQAGTLLGEFGRSEVQKAIRDRHFAPNKPSTISRKKSDLPLLDTGELLAVITYKVTSKDRPE